MYRAAILCIDRYLSGNGKPTTEEITYNLTVLPLICSLAKEIVMSIPSLATTGGIFLLYPAMRAAKVLSKVEKDYIVLTLNRMASEVPVTVLLASHVLGFGDKIPTLGQCKLPMEFWDI